MKWRRTTAKDGTLQSSLLKLGPQLREVTVHRHIDDPEQLFVSCHPINLRKGLGTLDFQIAEIAAINVITHKLETMLREVKGAE